MEFILSNKEKIIIYEVIFFMMGIQIELSAASQVPCLPVCAHDFCHNGYELKPLELNVFLCKSCLGQVSLHSNRTLSKTGSELGPHFGEQTL